MRLSHSLSQRKNKMYSHGSWLKSAGHFVVFIILRGPACLNLRTSCFQSMGGLLGSLSEWIVGHAQAPEATRSRLAFHFFLYTIGGGVCRGRGCKGSTESDGGLFSSNANVSSVPEICGVLVTAV